MLYVKKIAHAYYVLLCYSLFALTWWKNIFQDSSVKRSFLKCSAAQLCVFFGPQRAKEVILSHMITFLNDKVHVLVLADSFTY